MGPIGPISATVSFDISTCVQKYQGPFQYRDASIEMLFFNMRISIIDTRWLHNPPYDKHLFTWEKGLQIHDDVIKWKHYPHHWPFVQGIHQSPVNSQHKAQWCRALMFSLICAWLNGWINNRKADDLRCHHAHYDVTIILTVIPAWMINYRLNKGWDEITYLITNFKAVLLKFWDG